MTELFTDIDETRYRIQVYEQPYEGEDVLFVDGLIALSPSAFATLEKQLQVFENEGIIHSFSIEEYEPEKLDAYNENGVLNFIAGIADEKDEKVTFQRKLWDDAATFTRAQVESGEYPGYPR